MDVRFHIKCNTKDSLGNNHMVFNPTNQTTIIGKKVLRNSILRNSYENPLNQRDLYEMVSSLNCG